MIRQLISGSPEILDLAIKMLYKKHLLIDYRPIEKINNMSSVVVNVKCDIPGLEKAIGASVKKFLIVRNPV